ncbi:MAG: helix-turn-helix transcriptional regulator [Chlorobi bacterium]|uniref:Helix-turn-helix domain-containing protein n=2 Tax=Chryseobacterium TaxID=59732 RepID=A0AAJ1R2T6_9FLAO|nr:MULTISPECIES: helix-turn-helix domain-containing protein [Chryseobacterium]NPA07608.1 helix-turn-helix transcriptional regulator [Chlorobiota bacterium]MCF2219780.1 helix-turn-helix transcriptional regulator [Chryseobacterium sp. PS-8]MDN4012554.1 helix-turn-helix domain-containing protein [Chryseobacterium gambrini]MDN4031809.1 helix-turn-helix domain-containing protein [Chryseobacterium gambrini]QWA38452.1 helix-turn-helix transcriptional regulator [Chryseobacterium sp. ZHDP1]
MNEKKSKFTDCPITRTAEVLGGKWSLPIIFALMKETSRFKELERKIEGINTRMLVKELKQLEENGIVLRKVYAEVPPKVEYSLTEKGKALKSVLVEMKNWGNQFLTV